VKLIKFSFINGNHFFNKTESKSVEELFCGIDCVYQAGRQFTLVTEMFIACSVLSYI